MPHKGSMQEGPAGFGGPFLLGMFSSAAKLGDRRHIDGP